MASSNREENATTRFEGEEHHGWSPDLGAEGGTAAEAAREARKKPTPEPESGQDRSPGGTLSATDVEPGSPYGAGESDSRGAEEIAPDTSAEGHKGESQRPYGGRTAEDASGVNPENPRDPESPNLPPA
ncbi:MAG TPA: hypothetical protein VJX66_02900 [Amycolatopsis sp.]|nr:hypothetical protein [Amycolatopsis sp.]